MLRTQNYDEKTLLNYLDGVLSIMFDEVYLMNRTSKWFCHIQNFNKEHFIRPYNVTESNKHKEERFISCMTTTRFINGQDESICYVNRFFKFVF